MGGGHAVPLGLVGWGRLEGPLCSTLGGSHLGRCRPRTGGGVSDVCGVGRLPASRGWGWGCFSVPHGAPLRPPENGPAQSQQCPGRAALARDRQPPWGRERSLPCS